MTVRTRPTRPILLACAAAITAVISSGCAGPGQSVTFEPAAAADVSGLTGSWQVTEGSVFRIADADGGSVRVTLPDGERYRAVISSVEGDLIIEVALSDRDEAGDDAVPVFHYGRLAVDGDTLRHEPLNPAWLAAQSEGDAEISGAELAAGGQSVAVAEGESMRRMLVRACNSDDAWGEVEVFTRVE